MKRRFRSYGFEITSREIIASISIICIMMLLGILVSSKISDRLLDKDEIYNKAAKIESTELFKHGMETNAGNAFVYGELKAVDTVTYPELQDSYMYVHRIEERRERHTRTVTKKDNKGKSKTVREVYYEWDEYDDDSLHSEQISFCDVVFPYDKIKMPDAEFINEQSGDKVYSWKSGEFVKVRFKYYGVAKSYKGTIFTSLMDNTIFDDSDFYENCDIDQTIKKLESRSPLVIFWVVWICFIGVGVFGFFYAENKWLY